MDLIPLSWFRIEFETSFKKNIAHLWMASVFLVSINTANALAPEADLLNKAFPPNISFGLTIDELKERRPNVVERKRPLKPAQRTDSLGEYDLIEQVDKATVYWYIAKNGRIRAMQRLERLSASDSPTIDSLFNPANFPGLKSGASKDILRVRNGLTSTVHSIDHWTSESEAIHIYLLKTPEERTLILFEAASYAVDDFFISAAEKPRVDKSLKRLQTRIPIPQPSTNQTGIAHASNDQPPLLTDSPISAANSQVAPAPAQKGNE